MRLGKYLFQGFKLLLINELIYFRLEQFTTLLGCLGNLTNKKLNLKRMRNDFSAKLNFILYI